jgi:hypothetical protein
MISSSIWNPNPKDKLACFWISMGYLWDRPGILTGAGYPRGIFRGFWDMTGISQIQKTWKRISQIKERYPKIRKPGRGYPKTNQ